MKSGFKLFEDQGFRCGDISKQYCQTLGLVLKLRVNFVLPLSQEEKQEEQEQEQEQPLTEIY